MKGGYKNRPYVKQYDKEGNLMNPIKGAYTHKDVKMVMNRSQRRKYEKILKKLLNTNK